MAFALGIATNALNIVAMWLLAKRIWYAPIFASCVQVLWIAYIWALGPAAYPMLITTLPVTIIWLLAIPKWSRFRQNIE